MSFRLVPKSATLNAVMAHATTHYTAKFTVLITVTQRNGGLFVAHTVHPHQGP